MFFLLQIDPSIQASQIDASVSLTSVITCVSFVTGILSIILAIVSLCRSSVQNKESKLLNGDTRSKVESLGTQISNLQITASKLEELNTLINNNLFGTLNKTIGGLTRKVAGGFGSQDKKDIEKVVADNTEKVEGQLKGLTDTMDKNQMNMTEIRTILDIVRNAVFDVLNKVIDDVDDYIEGEHDDYEYIKDKILRKCKTDAELMVRDIFSATSVKIVCKRKLEIIEALKIDGVIIYKDVELCDNTIISLSVKIENPTDATAT